MKRAKNLLVFPGVGSPENIKYAEVYSVIEEGAKKYGYNQTNVVLWPGQKEIKNDQLTLDSAICTARSVIEDAEKQGDTYSILARSFGTIVCSKVLTEVKTTTLNRIILWGPPPFPVLWDLFKRNFIETKKIAKRKGTRIAENFFESILPVETLVSQIKCPAVITTGDKDMYSPSAFLKYLESLTDAKNMSFRDAVKGAPHEVDKKCPKEVIEEYWRTIFL